MKLYIGENIKFLRLKKQLSPPKLAAEIGLDKKAVYTWEKKTHHPSIINMIKLCDFFDVSISDFLFLNMKAIRKNGK